MSSQIPIVICFFAIPTNEFIELVMKQNDFRNIDFRVIPFPRQMKSVNTGAQHQDGLFARPHILWLMLYLLKFIDHGATYFDVDGCVAAGAKQEVESNLILSAMAPCMIALNAGFRIAFNRHGGAMSTTSVCVPGYPDSRSRINDNAASIGGKKHQLFPANEKCNKIGIANCGFSILIPADILRKHSSLPFVCSFRHESDYRFIYNRF